jgi:hypothetical protein
MRRCMQARASALTARFECPSNTKVTDFKLELPGHTPLPGPCLHQRHQQCALRHLRPVLHQQQHQQGHPQHPGWYLQEKAEEVVNGSGLVTLCADAAGDNSSSGTNRATHSTHNGASRNRAAVVHELSLVTLVSIPQVNTAAAPTGPPTAPRMVPAGKSSRCYMQENKQQV